jgi:hypothetical protein
VGALGHGGLPGEADLLGIRGDLVHGTSVGERSCADLVPL